MAAITEHLRKIKTIFEDALVIEIFVTSSFVEPLRPATAVFKTLSDKNLKWEDVTARLIEVIKALKTEKESVTSAQSWEVDTCRNFIKQGHDTDHFYRNALNSNKKLNLPSGSKSEESRKSLLKKSKGRNKQKDGGARTAMTMHKNSTDWWSYSLIKSHMSSSFGRLRSTTVCNFEVKLSYDSTIDAKSKIIRNTH